MNDSRNKSEVEAVLFAEAHHTGYGSKRQRWEDRCIACEVQTAAGLDFVIGIIADGFGDDDSGEAASQLAVDAVLNFLQGTMDIDPNKILYRAVSRAHNEVFNYAGVNGLLRSMGSTITVAAVYQGKLYVAHLGNSRAYIVRAGHIVQLTMDHTWGNDQVRLRQLTYQESRGHNRRDELSRYLGQSGDVEFDVGLRVDGEVDSSKSVLATGGLELLPDDGVVICSDGLIKERPDGSGHFVEPDEIIQAVNKNKPQDSVNALISLAVNRQVDENVSVVVLKAPRKRMSFTALAKLRPTDAPISTAPTRPDPAEVVVPFKPAKPEPAEIAASEKPFLLDPAEIAGSDKVFETGLAEAVGSDKVFKQDLAEVGASIKPANSRLWIGVALIGLAVISLVATVIILVTNLSAPELATVNTVAISSGVTQTTAPTATMIPLSGFADVLEVNGLAQVDIPGQEPLMLTIGMRLPTGKDIRIWTTSGMIKFKLEDGSTLYVGPDTILYLDSIAAENAEGEQTEIIFEKGQVLGISEKLLFRVKQGDFQALLISAKMGITYDPQVGKFMGDCLSGLCQVMNGLDRIDLAAGEQGGYDNGSRLPVGGAQYEAWLALGGSDVPTPTETPTWTASPTQVSTATQEAIPPTNTLPPPPTNTLPPPPTVTPRPTNPPPPPPTATQPPPPPTNTQPPPTEQPPTEPPPTEAPPTESPPTDTPAPP